MAKVYLGLGSNVGNKFGNLKKAIQCLKRILRIRKISPIYETEPVGYRHQSWFLNCAVEAETDKKPLPLLNCVKLIEKKLKRKKTFKFGPRTIDIDILFYGDKIIKSKNLNVPHPRMHERLFVLQPLGKIAPKFLHPRFKKTIKELKKEVKVKTHVKLYPKKI